ncbi:hypothetical protein [uncultured Mailhella sp.]|uniref:hypothetical protein n=1 Tax=uncultured Mailhella sp. TaxID=1981031 RepID=UPI0025E99B1B|nr:hypothetical protein [uncultured Mailhella sp.]
MMKPLFSAPDSFSRRALERLFPILDSVMPMNGAQRRDLAMACRDLSAMLTTERNALARPYWTSPRLTSAYLRYFLPWNLVRLSALLPGLDFGRIPDAPVILDMGSGPLTLPIALWMSRPDLRERPVTLIASDTTPHILELGRKIFDALRAELFPESPWTLRTMRASVTQAPRRVYAKSGSLWMMSMGNVLNEMEERRAKPGHQMTDRMRELLESSAEMLCENGLLLSVEPGTRQGGRLVAHLRKSALGGVEEEPEYEDLTAFALREEQAGRRTDEEDDWDDDMDDFGLPPLFMPLSPCPHAGSCPMLDRRTTAWCHMNAPADHAPESLRALSARAGLDKDSVSLSFLLMRRMSLEEIEAFTPPERPESRRVPARIISDAFMVPGYPGRARYACSPLGLSLIPNSSHLPAGALCEARVTRERDMKSRAVILSLEDAPGRFRHAPDAREDRRRDGRGETASRRERPGQRRERQKRDAGRSPGTDGGRKKSPAAFRREDRKGRSFRRG